MTGCIMAIGFGLIAGKGGKNVHAERGGGSKGML